ncbi:hypothetical protein [Streptomyces rimosus]|uniref:hypothetical protein n=1 Tax=Streptomyces rimosus TaxID=1927 RepID=UPI00379F242B
MHSGSCSKPGVLGASYILHARWNSPQAELFGTILTTAAIVIWLRSNRASASWYAGAPGVANVSITHAPRVVVVRASDADDDVAALGVGVDDAVACVRIR